VGVADGWAKETLAALEARGLKRTLEPLVSRQGPVVQLEGGGALVNFSSNDYLGLSSDPGLIAAAHQAVDLFGVGAGASRLVVGDGPAHRALEEAAARVFATESALAFTSGYAGNVGLISALVGPGDAVFSDALNHASLIDGCRLSRAQVHIYPHADVEALQHQLHASNAKRKLVVTDAVFSMEGDVAPLAELALVCAHHGAALMVDEAHALGVLGPTGGGACEGAGVTPDVKLGTLSKALGSAGAFAGASRTLCDLFLNQSRSFVFSTAMSPVLAWVGAAALERLRVDSSLRERLWNNIRTFAEGLQHFGLPAKARSAIFSVVLGTPEAAVEASLALRRQGVLAKAIRPPTVPQGKSCLRFTVTAAHTPEHLERAMQALAVVLPRVPVQALETFAGARL